VATSTPKTFKIDVFVKKFILKTEFVDFLAVESVSTRLDCFFEISSRDAFRAHQIDGDALAENLVHI
jgi:hypothetical protein